MFVFNTYVGAVTWDELSRFRSRKDCLVPLIALFPENPPSGELIRRPAGARGWADLLDKKETLTADWNKEGSQSLTPVKDYRDLDHLKNIILDQVKRVLGGLLKTNAQKKPKATEKPIEVKSEAELRIAYETTAKSRHPCVGVNLGDLDWELVEGFRKKESPSSSQESNRGQVLAELGLFSPLSPSRCLHTKKTVIKATDHH